jgi:ABC-2 type transport system permease protein
LKSNVFVIAKKEFIQIRRDIISLIISLLIPPMLLFLFGYAINFELRKLSIGVYDMDRSQKSKDYIEAFTNTKHFKLKYFINSYKEIKYLFDNNKVTLIIIIPPNFSRRLSEGLRAEVQTLIDGSFSNTAQLAINYFYAINNAYSQKITIEYLKRIGYKFTPVNIDFRPRAWYNPSLRNETFIVTGLFTIIVMGFIPILSALAIVKERETGSIQIIFSSPIKPYEYIAGKMIPYILLTFLDIGIVMIAGSIWFDIPFRGNVFILAVASFLFVFSTVSLGFLISTVVKNQTEAMLLAIIMTLMPAFIFSGSIAPISNMPYFFGIYSHIFPARYFNRIVRMLFLKGAELKLFWDSLAALFLYTVIIFLICAYRVKKKRII